MAYHAPMGVLRPWHLLALLCLFVVAAIVVGVVVLVVTLNRRT